VTHAALSAAALAVLAAAWLLSGADGSWIVWPALGLGGALAAHAVCREHVALGATGSSSRA
jgi:hypothetical protein